MAVLSRSGCNQGTCHGNQNGKGGLKLSLRGDDPAFDYEALTREMLGRRTDPLRPADSLLLLKATAQVPHEGGKRFAADSLEYSILQRWIADNRPVDAADLPRLKRIEVTPTAQVLIEPADRVQLQVRATFHDGSVRDVTRLAAYDPANAVAVVSTTGEARKQRDGEATILVRYLDQRAAVQLAFVPERPGFVWQPVAPNNFIDEHIFAKLKTLRMQPSELCSDSVFLRRVYLDLLGTVPTAEEARQFLNDPAADKRARLIDRLLERPEFADFWALKWSDVLRNEEKTLDKKGVAAFHHWIRQSIAAGQPLNEFARDILAARGSTYSEPAANFYRALREPQARAEATAQVFLGIRIQCARCHNHPFDQWTQNDYHSLAAFFARIDYRIVENNRRDRLDAHEFDGEQVVYQNRDGEVQDPRTGESLRPRFLMAAKSIAPADRLQALADWMADPKNPFFARTQVNRVWHHLLGKGIVDPNDDFRASNPPVNGPLLKALEKDFIAHRFDLRHLVRTIANSKTYQLAVTPNDTNREDDINFARGLIRPLQAEQLLDSFAQVTGVPVKFNGYPRGMRAVQLPGAVAQRARGESATAGEQFLKVFGKPERLLSCECERSDDTTLNQAFQLLTGELLNQLLAEADNRLGQLLKTDKTDRAIIDDLYLSALSRPPSERELQASLAVVAKSRDRRAGLEDILWSLVNAKEFLLRR
ncbi:MAG: DUF1549 domain-containing protein [Planctomycetia bacterium]|nr:DUF1549 domain-containing protein [Planctomycetia bacterium]